MICPHCSIGTSPNWQTRPIIVERGVQIYTDAGTCTECKQAIVVGEWRDASGATLKSESFYPHEQSARPVAPEVTEPYCSDFQEAATALRYSPKASAALSRRLLQHVLREKGHVKPGNLYDEIQRVIEAGEVSSGLADDLDTVRVVGNFAAHPIKSTNTGEIVDVEPGEAEWLLDVLEELLDHYFVKPARRAEQREQINAKLREAGKKELKPVPKPTAELPESAAQAPAQ